MEHNRVIADDFTHNDTYVGDNVYDTVGNPPAYDVDNGISEDFACVSMLDDSIAFDNEYVCDNTLYNSSYSDCNDKFSAPPGRPGSLAVLKTTNV